MMGRYDNWVNCKEDLLASGYRLERSREAVRGKLYSDLYTKGNGDHVLITMNYGPGWCDMACQVKYDGGDWKDLAGTIPIAFKTTETNLFLLDRDKFMEIVCRYEYEQLEAEFRKMEIESTLEALP